MQKLTTDKGLFSKTKALVLTSDIIVNDASLSPIEKLCQQSELVGHLSIKMKDEIGYALLSVLKPTVTGENSRITKMIQEAHLLATELKTNQNNEKGAAMPLLQSDEVESIFTTKMVGEIMPVVLAHISERSPTLSTHSRIGLTEIAKTFIQDVTFDQLKEAAKKPTSCVYGTVVVASRELSLNALELLLEAVNKLKSADSKTRTEAFGLVQIDKDAVVPRHLKGLQKNKHLCLLLDEQDKLNNQTETIFYKQ